VLLLVVAVALAAAAARRPRAGDAPRSQCVLSLARPGGSLLRRLLLLPAQ